MAFQGHVVQRVLIVISQALGVHVLVNFDADAQVYQGADGGIADFRDVGGFTGIGQGGQLAIVLVPGGLDDFNLDFGMDGGELIGPGFDIGQIGAGDRGNHHGDGIGFSQGRNDAKQQHGGQENRENLFHVRPSVVKLWDSAMERNPFVKIIQK